MAESGAASWDFIGRWSPQWQLPDDEEATCTLRTAAFLKRFFERNANKFGGAQLGIQSGPRQDVLRKEVLLTGKKVFFGGY